MGIEDIKKSVRETPGDVRPRKTFPAYVLYEQRLPEEEQNRDCRLLLVSIVKTQKQEALLTEKTWDERLLQGQVDSRCNLIILDSDLALVQPHIDVLGFVVLNGRLSS
jgi:hypothetical protein